MDENVYLFDYNVRLELYSIEISGGMYISIIADDDPLAFFLLSISSFIFLGKFAFPYLSPRNVGMGHQNKSCSGSFSMFYRLKSFQQHSDI